MGRVWRIPRRVSSHATKLFCQLNVAALQNLLGVFILSYEHRMDLSPDDFEGLWNGSSSFSTFKQIATPSRRTVSPCFRSQWNFHHANNILLTPPRDLYAKRDLLRNGPFFWDSFILETIRDAAALYRLQGVPRPLRASDMDETNHDAAPVRRERVRPRKEKEIALEDGDFVSEDLPLPRWNLGFVPGDGSGTSEAPLPDDFFANLPPGFTTPASLDEASRRGVVAERSVDQRGNAGLQLSA
ncbi:hypothetical protein Bca52824_023983 [Brassica carinata]|uniref:Uncharacterized protein n=1 Tax=Brassica carinata TaxID=52824 RepID=A0A8X7VJL7_BRACI|nr:hypothetical protein Bca52824_023983 [Brassica carinata]